MEKHSYCILHDTHPVDNEPCWACVMYFSEQLEGTFESDTALLLHAASKLVEMVKICTNKSNNSTDKTNGD